MAIIEVKNLTKEYQLGHLKSLKQSMLNGVNRLCGRLVEKYQPFKALDDVSFSIQEGEVVGIIGTNGAGKSTLLKHLARISTPTSGEVKVSGSVAPLIEVGAGLHPELSGRENIYLNGAIMGIPKGILRKKFDEIVAFSELEEFIDTPIKRYSSGMSVRLGFSIATVVDPDILIVDEVLAVGDLAFQRKCFDRMEDLIKRQGKTVLLVSHNIRQVERICNRVILLDHGKVVEDGHPAEVCESFFERSNRKIGDYAKTLSGKNVRSSGEVNLESIGIFSINGEFLEEVQMEGGLVIRAVFTCTTSIIKPEIVFGFHTTDFVYVSSMGTAHFEGRPSLVLGENIVECTIPYLSLVPGVYCIRIGVLDQYRREMFYGETLAVFNVVSNITSKMAILGLVHIPATWSQNGVGIE